MDYTKTLGWRNNNPTNIRYSAANNWQGQVGQEKGFCKFSSRYYGFRATFKIFKRYMERGLKTARLIVMQWAPWTENNVSAYCKCVSGFGVPMDEEITEGNQERILKSMVAGMVNMECGIGAVLNTEGAVIDNAYKNVFG